MERELTGGKENTLGTGGFGVGEGVLCLLPEVDCIVFEGGLCTELEPYKIKQLG